MLTNVKPIKIISDSTDTMCEFHFNQMCPLDGYAEKNTARNRTVRTWWYNNSMRSNEKGRVSMEKYCE